jgi:cell division septation protein DedD
MNPEINFRKEPSQPHAASEKTTLLPWILLSCACAFLLGMIAFLWHQSSSSKPTQTDSIPTLSADASPSRVRPNSPGGMNIPNQDKTIYQTLENPPRLIAPSQMNPGLEPPKLMTPPPPTLPRLSQTPAKPTQTAPNANLEKWSIQLGSFSSQDSVNKAAAQLQKNYDVLKKLSFTTESIEIPEKGIWYRLFFGPLETESQARSMCKLFQSKKLGCIISPPKTKR